MEKVRGRVMKPQAKTKVGYAVCINNDGYPAALERNKIYRMLPDARAKADGYLRIVDESGEDYLYPEDFFFFLTLPRGQAATLSRSLSVV